MAPKTCFDRWLFTCQNNFSLVLIFVIAFACLSAFIVIFVFPSETSREEFKIENHKNYHMFKNQKCGHIRDSIRIRNGNKAGLLNFPWNVQIYAKHDLLNHPTFVCGGSLISRHLILTSAHCLLINNTTP
jgi:hypothetical protein